MIERKTEVNETVTMPALGAVLWVRGQGKVLVRVADVGINLTYAQAVLMIEALQVFTTQEAPPVEVPRKQIDWNPPHLWETK